MSETYRDLLWSKSRYFSSKNHRLGLGPIDTGNSDPYHAGLHVKKCTGEGWNQYSHFVFVLSTLLCVLKTTDEVWDMYRLVSLVLKSLF